MSSPGQQIVAGAEDQAKATEVLEILVNRAYDRAKCWSAVVLGLQALIFLAGIVAVFAPRFTLSYPWIALPLAAATAYIAGRASGYKGLAERAKRQHEYLVNFGYKPSGGQLADLRQSLQRALAPEMHALLKAGISYSSVQPYGTKRTLENLSESAWFTKHLASICARWVGFTFVTTLTIAISLLLWSAHTAAGSSAGIATAKGVAATLMFLVSVGSIRGWLGYQSLSLRAGDIDAEAGRLGKSEDPPLFETQRILAEYQLIRASAPLIPTWMWRLHRDSLNENWKLKMEN